ncbi:hypothetical protein V5799_010141 [Amblyomma americanum]|uniref:Uncharacterized protein n=1 Tax=Amblyomma americanum TaxID=6943 RepID=A0AAQ4F8F9_AMBAM
MRPLAHLLPALLAIVARFAATVRRSRRQLVAYAVLATPFAFLHVVLLCFDKGIMTSEHARAGAGGPQSPIHLDKMCPKYIPSCLHTAASAPGQHRDHREAVGLREHGGTAPGAAGCTSSSSTSHAW